MTENIPTAKQSQSNIDFVENICVEKVDQIRLQVVNDVQPDQ